MFFADFFAVHVAGPVWFPVPLPDQYVEFRRGGTWTQNAPIQGPAPQLEWHGWRGVGL
jgi:hypothetical protein